MSDSVSHPSHYNSGKFEAIDVIEDWDLGFNLGNTVKYISRAGKKDPDKHLEDLKKARWYLEREIANLSKVPPMQIEEEYKVLAELEAEHRHFGESEYGG